MPYGGIFDSKIVAYKFLPGGEALFIAENNSLNKIEGLCQVSADLSMCGTGKVPEGGCTLYKSLACLLHNNWPTLHI